MNATAPFRRLRAGGLRHVLGAIALAAAALHGAPALADAGDLRAKYGELREQLRDNNFGRAMHVDSAEGNGSLRGDVYAVLDHPMSRVSQALREPAQWCDVMLLPFNVKSCQAQGQTMQVRIGRRYDQPVEQAFALQFNYRNVAAGNDYFESQLNAPSGPAGTRDYRIHVQAVPVDGNRTFMHLSYSYGYGTLAKVAMQAYFSGSGADKVGFSTMGKDENGKPKLTDGVRGAIERNAMRYYLAIDAYLDTVEAPREQQVEKRIQTWFSATERYARQLHEMDRATYVNMKRQEYGRQQTASVR